MDAVPRRSMDKFGNLCYAEISFNVNHALRALSAGTLAVPIANIAGERAVTLKGARTPMALFAFIAIGVIALLALVFTLVTKKQFKRMGEHPEEFPHHYSHEPKE